MIYHYLTFFCLAANPYKEYHDGEDIFGEDIDNIGLGGPNDPLQIFSGRPDIQIETRPPVVLITTVTRVVEMAELLPTVSLITSTIASAKFLY